MITATVKGFERWGEVTADIDKLCIEALDEAAHEAAAVADANAFIPLELEVQPAVGDIEGFSSGIVSRKRGRTEPVRIAPFFDQGTLAGRAKPLKRNRRASWTVRRKGSTFTAHRHPIVPAEGIEAQHFFSAARSAGRKVLLTVIDRGV